MNNFCQTFSEYKKQINGDRLAFSLPTGIYFKIKGKESCYCCLTKGTDTPKKFAPSKPPPSSYQLALPNCSLF